MYKHVNRGLRSHCTCKQNTCNFSVVILKRDTKHASVLSYTRFIFEQTRQGNVSSCLQRKYEVGGVETNASLNINCSGIASGLPPPNQ